MMGQISPKTINSLGADEMSQSQALGVFCTRISNLSNTHWDLNAIWQLRKDASDAQKLFKSNEKIELNSIFDILDACLNEGKFPDAGQANMLLLLGQEMQTHGLALISESAPALPSLQTHQISKRIETPPKAFWRHWTKLITSPASLITKNEANPISEHFQKPLTTSTTNHNTGSKVMHDTNAKYSRIYHLSDYNKLSIELNLMLENAGMDVELLNTTEELMELLQALPADLVLIDPSFLESFDLTHAAIKQLQKNTPKKTPIFQLTDTNSKPESIIAATATCDACASMTDDTAAIVTHIEQLLRFGKQDQYRVLIVEDDRSQAMFAEGILRNAEIITRVLLQSDTLLKTIEEFLPDLILMDLYMPNANGIELTELIRKSEHFQNTPIVFLSGEIDEDKQADALDAGGDDFLIKPIRPRRLIAAVQNRIKRHRTMQLEIAPQALIPERQHLVQRSEMLEQITSDISNNKKALMFIEISSYSYLEATLGLTALESLLKEFSGFLIQTCAPKPVARFRDNSFVLIYEGDCSRSVLSTFATKLRSQLMSYKFISLDHLVDLRINIGICDFESADQDSNFLIDAAMRSAQIARKSASGIDISKPKSNATKEREERLVAMLRNVDDNQCLSHIYQPIVAVGGSEEKQFQCLLRLKDNSGEIVSAAEFIPLAEKNNLITAIDRWSLTHAISKIMEFSEKGEEIKLFVTQSKQTLPDNEQIDWLKNLLQSNKIPANCLVIEINHKDALNNQQSIEAICKALANERVQFCLSRYNPKNDLPNMLESLPINYLKLDHKLNLELSLSAIRDDVKDIIDRAHSNGIEVIGHSVEDAKTAASLWMNGIDFIQGNLIQSANEKLDFGFDQAIL